MCKLNKRIAALIIILILCLASFCASAANQSARDRFIDQMLELAKETAADKKENFRRAHYKEDIGVCKNYVTYLFNMYKNRYVIGAFPSASLRMPTNNPAEKCAPYDYGVEWADVSAQSGNPFTIAGSFRYNENMSEKANRRAAADMLRKAKRGDFLQLRGEYGGGNGPHSLIFIADCVSDKLRWADSNMTGKFIDGIRWGYVKYDTQASVEWMVDVICKPKYGATLYRLRSDLKYK